MPEVWISLIAGLLVGGLLACLLYGAIHVRLGNRLFLALGVGLIVFVYLWNPNARVYSYHGFMHASFVYQILAGNVPPNCPLLAGEPLLYPWAFHVLAGGIAWAFRVTPFTAFALINVVSLACTLALAFKITRLLFADRITGILGAALSVFGMTPFCRGPLADLTQNLFPVIRIANRGIPPVVKFMNVNANSLGIMFFALFLYSALSVFSPRSHRTYAYGGLAISVLGTGILYPFILPVMILTSAVVCFLMYLREGRSISRTLVGVVISIGSAVLVSLPYLFSMTTSENAARLTTLTLSPARFFAKGAGILFITSVILALLYARRRTLLALPRANLNSVLIVAAAVATPAVMYVILSPPSRNEYKFLLLCCFSLGILSGAVMESFLRNRGVGCVLLLACLFLPLSSILVERVGGDWPVSDAYREDGRHLHAADPDENALYTWIDRHTDSSAVFVDTKLTIPIFARRQLYVGLDDPSRGDTGAAIHNGWGSATSLLLRVMSYPAEMVELRQRIAAALCSGDRSPISSKAFAELARGAGGADVYVVARNRKATDSLSSDDRFREVFQTQAVGLYHALKK